MATVARENIGLLNDKITVTISKEDYLPTFEKKVKEYSKNANIPGFRKGMVPVGMVKKMYGASIFTDEILKTVEKELYSYLQTENPEIFAQPIALDADIRKMDYNNPSEYAFGFEIGLKPSFEIAPLSTAALTLHKVKATDEQVQEEVTRMQIKGGKMAEKEVVDHEDNVLTVQFTESDASGAVVEGGISKENTVMLKLFTVAVQGELKGKKVGDSITIQLNNAFDGEQLERIQQDLGLTAEEAAAKSFTLTINKIGLVEKRELNEEFFNEVFPGAAVATEEEFRLKLKEEIEQYWLSQSRNQLHDQIYHFLLDNTQIELPENFLKKWLQTGGDKPKTAEEAEAEFPMFSNQLRWTLISDKIIKENSLDVSMDEVKASMKAEVMQYFGGASFGDDTSFLDSYVERMIKDEKHVETTYRRLITDKLFTFVEAQTNPAEKEVTAEQLAEMMHNHQH